MVNYDSDSSGGEDNDYTETNVLLGYASGDANGEEISRLGGRPVCVFSLVPFTPYSSLRCAPSPLSNAPINLLSAKVKSSIILTMMVFV